MPYVSYQDSKTRGPMGSTLGIRIWGGGTALYLQLCAIRLPFF